MPDLQFVVEGATPLRHAVAPTLAFKLRVANATPAEPIQAILLRCQLQIDAVRRHYTVADQPGLFELFGEPAQWSRTVRTLLWTITTSVVPPFTDSVVTDLYVPCTYDFNVAATKYFYALADGEVPLTFLFSGTVYYTAPDGRLQVTQISWNCEAAWNLPVSVWHELMEHYYPNSAWLRLRQDVFDQLTAYKRARGLPTWEQVIAALMEAGAALEHHEPEPG
jgi:hypothetical protein